MRVLPIFAAAVLLVGTAVADDKQDRERRVRVALALAQPATSPQTGEVCGVCRDDVEACRKEGLKEGKPVVLFVGGCPGKTMSEAACSGGGIPVRVKEYADGEHTDPAQKRVVVLEPKKDRSGFLRVDLPADVSAGKLTEKVKQSGGAKGATGAPLNWSF